MEGFRLSFVKVTEKKKKRFGPLSLQYMALIGSRGHREELIELINQKEVVGDLFNQLRLALQRRSKGRPAQVCLFSYKVQSSCCFRVKYNGLYVQLRY